MNIGDRDLGLLFIRPFLVLCWAGSVEDASPTACEARRQKREKCAARGEPGAAASRRAARKHQMDGAGTRDGPGGSYYSRETWRAHALCLLMIAALTQITERSQLLGWRTGGGGGREGGGGGGGGTTVAGLGRGDALCC